MTELQKRFEEKVRLSAILTPEAKQEFLAFVKSELIDARVDENEKWIQDAFNCGALKVELIDIRNRIKELRK